MHNQLSIVFPVLPMELSQDTLHTAYLLKMFETLECNVVVFMYLTFC